jgi:hypothetical protein
MVSHVAHHFMLDSDINFYEENLLAGLEKHITHRHSWFVSSVALAFLLWIDQIF